MFRLDADADTAARREVADHSGTAGRDGGNDIVEDPVHDSLGKDGLIAVGTEIVFERLALDTAALGGVADDDLGKIGLAGHGAVRGEFLRGKGDFVVALRRTLKSLQHRLVGRCELGKRAASQKGQGRGGIFGASSLGHEAHAPMP